MNRRLVYHLLLLLTIVALVAPACGPAEPVVEPTEVPPVEEPVEEPTEEPVEEPTEEPVEEPVREPTEFVFAHPGPIYTMDAPVTWYGATHWLLNLLYDCLIWRDADGGGYHGQAAESWEAVEPTRWRFHLRPGLTFHNGEPLDAEAVKWNIDRVRTDEELMVQVQWQFVKEVQVVDELTLDIMTEEPHAYFEYDVSYNGCQILPPNYFEEVGPEAFASNPVGSGPYQLVEFERSERYVFEAWEDYHGGRPEVDRVVYQVIPEKATQIAALLAGQVDAVGGVPLPEAERLEAVGDFDLMRSPTGRTFLLNLRFESHSGTLQETYPGHQATTEDIRIRQAVNHALDRELLGEIQGLGRPGLLRVDNWEPENRGQWAGEEAAIAHYDPELARQLIIEAGYDLDAGERPLVHFDSLAQQLGNEKEVAEAIAAMLEDVGFEVELNILETAAYMEQVYRPGNVRELSMRVIGGGMSLVPLFYACQYGERPNWDICYYVEGEWDDLSEAIMKEVDYEARMELVEEFWDFYVEAVLEAPTIWIDQIIAINSRFEWTPRTDGWMTFRDLRVVE